MRYYKDGKYNQKEPSETSEKVKLFNIKIQKYIYITYNVV